MEDPEARNCEGAGWVVRHLTSLEPERAGLCDLQTARSLTLGARAGMRSKPNQEPVKSRDRAIVTGLARWFRHAARDLPWRLEAQRVGRSGGGGAGGGASGGRDPYRSLVSEFMLQQTQVSRVLEKFEPFLQRFPTVGALAAASEHDVLAAWSGLGYYRRARLLHACAKAIVRDFGGEVPRNVESLQSLPGIGRYTAGAIASIVFDQAEPIVDGNVCRVLQRLDAKPGSASDKAVAAWAWERAQALVHQCSDASSESAEASRRRVKDTDAANPAAFNEGLMELGALVCTPAAPKCLVCPLRDLCLAREQGLVDEIPAPKARAKRSRVYHDTVVVWRKTARGVEVLLEQRPATGLWAGLWQPPTVESATRTRRTLNALLSELGLPASEAKSKPREWVFQTTHREVCFRVWVCTEPACMRMNSRWISLASCDEIAMANAHKALLHDSCRSAIVGD